MKILVVGSGGREHTLVWKIAQSPLETVLVSNTVPLRCEQEKLTVVSVAPALAEAIQCILSGRRIATV